MSFVNSTRFLGISVQREMAEESRVPNSQSGSLGASDESLLARCAGGDGAALTVLFRRYYGLLRMVSFRILRDECEADDLAQEVFLFVHNHAGIYDSSKSTGRSWLVQITYRRAISRRRYLAIRGHYRKKESVEDLCERRPYTTADPSLKIESLFARDCISKVMAELTEEQY